MSTTVGNGLTVDGTVKASQATQAGEAVVLGDDGHIPANLVAGGGGKVITEYTSISELIAAYNNGDIPLFSDVYIYAVDSYNGKLSTVYARCTGTLPWPILSSIVHVTNSKDYYVKMCAVDSFKNTYVRILPASNSTQVSGSFDFKSSGNGTIFNKAIVVSE